MSPKVFSRELPAVLIIIMGIGFLLDGLGVWEFGPVLADWWPVGIILAGLLNLLSHWRYPLWPVFVMTAGILLLLQETGVLNFDVWEVVWPMALIVLGISIIYKRATGRQREINDDAVGLFGAFSGYELASISKNFKGGWITILFGGAKLDLRQAVIKRQADLEIFTAFGGAEIIVPKDWRIIMNGIPLFGGWEDKTTKIDSHDSAPELSIHGVCMFGGVEVKNT
jgi:Domain of unknown function (DUF5668)